MLMKPILVTFAFLTMAAIAVTQDRARGGAQGQRQGGRPQAGQTQAGSPQAGRPQLGRSTDRTAIYAPSYGGGPYGYGGYGYGGYGYGYYGDGSGSTVAGSTATGMANVIQAKGQNSLANSEAANNYEEARSKNYDNNLKGTQTYFEMKQMNQSYRESQMKPRSPEFFAKVAAERAPSRLTSSQLDPVTGAIAWPMILQGEAFAPDREKLDALFAQRIASHGSIGLQSYQELQATSEAMLQMLKDNIRQYPPQDYVQAKSFLESLAYEAGFPLT